MGSAVKWHPPFTFLARLEACRAGLLDLQRPEPLLAVLLVLVSLQQRPVPGPVATAARSSERIRAPVDPGSAAVGNMAVVDLLPTQRFRQLRRCVGRNLVQGAVESHPFRAT